MRRRFKSVDRGELRRYADFPSLRHRDLRSGSGSGVGTDAVEFDPAFRQQNTCWLLRIERRQQFLGIVPVAGRFSEFLEVQSDGVPS